jgi:hypothetical protein
MAVSAVVGAGGAIEPVLAEMCKYGVMRGIRDACYEAICKDGKIIPEPMGHSAQWAAPPPQSLGLEGVTATATDRNHHV